MIKYVRITTIENQAPLSNILILLRSLCFVRG